MSQKTTADALVREFVEGVVQMDVHAFELRRVLQIQPSQSDGQKVDRAYYDQLRRLHVAYQELREAAFAASARI